MGLSKIPSPAEWQDRTRVLGRFRSSQMQAIDNAIKSYDKTKSDTDQRNIRIALQTWKLAKGLGWQQNERNRSGIISELDTFLDPQGANGVVQSVLTPESREALKIVQDHARDFLFDLFHNGGKPIQLKWKIMTAQEYVQITGSDGKTQDLKRMRDAAGHGLKTAQRVNTAFNQGKTIAGNINTVGKPLGLSLPGTGLANTATSSVSQITSELQTQLLDSAAKLLDVAPGSARVILEEVLNHVGLVGLADFISDCVPFLSVIKDGATVGKKLVEYGLKRHTMSTLKSYAYIMAAGSPEKALDALNDMLKDEAKDIRNDGAKAVVSGTVGVVTHFFSLGAAAPVMAAAKAMVSLLLLIQQGLEDYKTIRDTNKFLMETSSDSDKFAKQLFDKAPLLACYFVMIAETSTLLNVLGENFGTASWQKDVELYARKLDAMRDEAARIIAGSRMTCVGLKKHRLAAKASMLHNVKMALASFGASSEEPVKT